jgi:hypothetical protein
LGAAWAGELDPLERGTGAERERTKSEGRSNPFVCVRALCVFVCARAQSKRENQSKRRSRVRNWCCDHDHWWRARLLLPPSRPPPPPTAALVRSAPTDAARRNPPADLSTYTSGTTNLPTCSPRSILSTASGTS